MASLAPFFPLHLSSFSTFELTNPNYTCISIGCVFLSFAFSCGSSLDLLQLTLFLQMQFSGKDVILQVKLCWCSEWNS